MEKPEGFELPVFRSVTEKVLMLGVPRELAIFNSALAAIFCFSLENPWLLPLNLIFHCLCRRITKWDAQFIDCLKRHINRKDYYGV